MLKGTCTYTDISTVSVHMCVCVCVYVSRLFHSSEICLESQLQVTLSRGSSPSGHIALSVAAGTWSFSHLLVFSMSSVFSNKNLYLVCIILLWSVNA